MSNKVKVIGYAKRDFYNNGIEYRNFSDNLVGNQFTEDGGSALFTMGNFRVTTNLDSKYNKNYQTGAFSKFYYLNNLKIDSDLNLMGFGENKIKLNLNDNDLSNYAYFGSLREFVRVSLENIITKWPASLFITETNQINPTTINSIYDNNLYDPITNTTSFEIPFNSIVNKFGINIKEGGNNLNTFNENNKLRDFNLSYGDYVLMIGELEYQVKEFDGFVVNELNQPNDTSDQPITLKVEGNPFPDQNNITHYHIKPNTKKIKKFYHELNGFENNLLNNKTTPKYRGEFTYEYQSDNGQTIIGKKHAIWPVSDGYNIDYDSDDYNTYVIKLLNIAKVSDIESSNLIINKLVSKSILEFDTIEEKIGKTLRIYGRNFDDIKNYIDGIKYINTVTYNKQNNVPDRLVKNLARTLGWELTTSLFNVDFNEDFYSGGELNLSPVESEIEFWRRLILNSPWIWKSKGTRKVIEFLLKFIGTPKGLVKFNEYIYKSNNKVDINLYKKMLSENGLEYNENTSVIDGEGYPRILPNTPEMYFQKGGLWYRETGGPNSNIDVLSGNNPHIGPYDRGYEYINQYNVLINEDSRTIRDVRNVITRTTGYLNYNNGVFDGLYTNDLVVIAPLDVDFENLYDKGMENCKAIDGSCDITAEWTLFTYIDGSVIKIDEIVVSDNIHPTMEDLKGKYDNLVNELGLNGIVEDDEYKILVKGNLCDDINIYENNKIEFKIEVKIGAICDGLEPINCKEITLIGEDIFKKDDSEIESFIEVLDEDNFSVDSCFLVTDEFIQIKKDEYEECDTCSDSRYKIRIEKIKSDDQNLDCGFTSFKLDGDGTVNFTHSDGTNNSRISKVCCESLGFISKQPTNEYSKKYALNKCYWKEEYIEDECSNYYPIDTSNVLSNSIKATYIQFKNIKTGGKTEIVPTAECCRSNGGIPIKSGEGFICKKTNEEEKYNPYDSKILTGKYDGEYALFKTDLSSVETTTIVSTPEYCTNNNLIAVRSEGGYKCKNGDFEFCDGFTVTDRYVNGYVGFLKNGIMSYIVNSPACCPRISTPEYTSGGVKCKINNDYGSKV